MQKILGRKATYTVVPSIAALLLSFTPAGLAAQVEETPEGYEAIGDWFVSRDADPFDDAVATNVMILVPDRSGIQGIRIAGLRCAAGPDGSDIQLRVGHSYMIPSRSDRNTVQLRFGDAEARREQGFAATGNEMTVVTVQWSDVEALVASPRLAVRITEGSSRSNDMYTESWSDIAGTADAVEYAMEPCRPAR